MWLFGGNKQFQSFHEHILQYQNFTLFNAQDLKIKFVITIWGKKKSPIPAKYPRQSINKKLAQILMCGKLQCQLATIIFLSFLQATRHNIDIEAKVKA